MKNFALIILFASTLSIVGCGGGSSAENTSTSTGSTTEPFVKSLIGKTFYNTDEYLIEQGSYITWMFQQETIVETQYGSGAFSDTFSASIEGDNLSIEGSLCTVVGDLTSFVLTCSTEEGTLKLSFWDTLEKAKDNPDKINP